MPTVAVVDGVKIIFYGKEHWPAHFHARLAEHNAVFDIVRLEMVQGTLPVAKKRKVIEWAHTRQGALLRAFGQAIAKVPVDPVE